MIQHPDFDPVALDLGFLQVHWYGIMYLIGFIAAIWLGRISANRSGGLWNKDEVADLIFYGAIGVIVGGRLGYVLFYNFPSFLESPLRLFYIWEGGMSFHGGLIGVLTAMWLYARKTERSFFTVTDFLAPLVPLGIAAGRFGNYINQELWGRTTDLPWGVVFTNGGSLPRHPSQLYEGFLEGILLFLILWFVGASKKQKTGFVSGLFLVFYALFRILVEFVREPDAHIGYLAFDWLTMGQVLSLPLLLFGVLLLWRPAKITT